MPEHIKQTIVSCPTCSKQIPWNDTQKWRPFCSERCKLIDLGEWANGNHHIPGEKFYPDEEDR